MKNTLYEPLSFLQEEVLNGSLLGDGCLVKSGDNTNAYFTIGRSIKDKEYLLYEHNIYRDLCTDAGGYYERNVKCSNGKIYKACGFHTRSLPVLTKYYKEWYPDNIKGVPNNLILTSQIIAIWLADDGCISYERNTNYKLKIDFATNSFTYDEIKFLADQLSLRYNECFKIKNVKWKDKRANQYIIQISDGGAIVLLRDINDYFPASMSRKSNIWLNEKVDFFNPNRELRPSRLKIKSILDKKLLELKEIGNPFCLSDLVLPTNNLEVSESTIIIWLKKLVKDNILSASKVKGLTTQKTQYIFKE